MRRYQEQVAELEGPAGLTERKGPGVVVTLSDAPDDVIDAATGDRKLLVVHQQDIQAVVNAMWKGGAAAVVIQGQRVVTTTGIKCEGSSVMLQGVPYPQPYVIEAVGDVGDLTTAISEDRYLQIYRDQSDDPAIAIGWDLDIEDQITAPSTTACWTSPMRARSRRPGRQRTRRTVADRPAPGASRSAVAASRSGGGGGGGS